MAEPQPGGLAASALARLTRRPRSLVIRPAVERVDGPSLAAYLARLGEDEVRAARLELAVIEAMTSILALSTLTSPLTLDYLDRLARPIPALRPETGVQIVTRAYVAHLVVERDPHAFGAVDVPVLGTLPALRRGSPPRDLLTRVVKASRRNFEMIRAISTPVWNGFVRGLTRRAHDQVADPGPAGLLAVEVVDGLARFGWVLRQVDLHYRLEPEQRSGSGQSPAGERKTEDQL
jgi:hypothetical protein